MRSLALLFSDVVDSTALVERLGDAQAAQVWAEHDRRARQLLAHHRGREIDRTDGFFLLFDAIADAARFALDYHAEVADLQISTRVSIHLGPVTLRPNPAEDVLRGAKPLEVEGLAKPLAARIMSLARGGQTLLSATACDAIAATLPPGTQLRTQGHYRLKGIEEPIELFALGLASGEFVPPADTDKAYRVVRAGDLWLPLREVRHNLASERDAFIGRGAELRKLALLLQSGSRLVTLLGTGGTGKTRLVRHYARAWLGDWPGGVTFCDLSEARTVDGLHFVVARALGVPLGKEDSTAQLGHAIAAHGHCLVILDNLEQLLPQATGTLEHWLDRAEEASFIVTSRERVRIPGEEVFAIDPLPLDSEATELFLVRAQAQQPRFELDDRNRGPVAEVVGLLDGLPLAIELAAARIRVLSPAQIVQRLQDRFTLLSSVRGVTTRQTTLRAAIDWSWDLLSAWEQATLAQCSVFDGGFTLEAAEAVVVLEPWPEAPPAMDAIQALVDKSLLRSRPSTASGPLDDAEPMFGMYLSIHEYASQKLHAFGDTVAAAAEERHSRYFAIFGGDLALDALMTHGGVAKRKRLALDLDNQVTACRRAIGRRQAELSAACFLAAWSVLEAQGPFKLAAALGREVCALDGLAPRQMALVQMALAQALRAEGHIQSANAVLSEALAVAQASQGRRIQAMTLRHLAASRHRDGHIDEAQQFFDAALALLEMPGDRDLLGMLLANLANLQMELGRMAEARATYQAALALHREVGNRAGEGIAVGNLGTLQHELGDAAEALASYHAALLIHREAGSLLQEAITLCNLGTLDRQQGALFEAAEHYRAALKIHRETGNRRGEGVVLGQIGKLQQMLGKPELARVHYDEALGIHREVGNRRFEGGVLGDLGELLAEQGRIEPSLQAMEAGERLLREVDDPLDLAKLLCGKGLAALASGDSETARSALTEAVSICTRLGAQPESDLGQSVERLRQAVG